MSVDSIYVHKMWNDHELSKMINKNIPFPMLSDQDGSIGRMYGIYDEPASRLNAAILIIYAVHFPDTAILIRQHGEGNIFIDHLRQFIIIPHLVHVNTVNTAGKYFYTQFLEFGMFFSNC